MATLTQEEIDFLKSQGLPVPNDTEEEETQTSEPVDASNIKVIPDEILGGTEEEWKAYTDSIIADSGFKAEETVPMETRDSFTYDNLYGTFTNPETGETQEAPDISLYTRVGALWYDLVNPSDAPKTESQEARDTYNEQKEQWTQATRDLYESNSFYTEDGKRIYDRYVPVRDEDGNITDYKYEKVLIPDPLLDQSTFNRAVEQAGRNIYQEFGGLVTEGAILGDSEFARSRADLDQSGGEAIGTTILSIAAPTLPIAKGFKYGGKLLGYGKDGAKTAQIGTVGTIGADSVAGALVEAIISKEGDEGLVIKGSAVQDYLPALPDAQAENIAMFLDGLIINGAADGMLSVMGKGFGYAWGKVSAGKQLANKQALKDAVTDGTILEVVKYLDPEFANLNAVEMKLRITALADVLNDNRVIQLSLGDATKEITNDTTNAIMMGSEAYIRETRAGLKNSMTPEAFEEMVKDEAARMSSSMIGLFRSQQSNPLVQSGADRVTNEIGEFVSDTATDLADGNIDTAAQNVASNVVAASDQQVANITAQADDVVRQTDELLAAQQTIIEDNPIVQDLLASNTGGYGLFNTNNREVRQALTDIVSDEAYTAFKETMDSVDAAYAALPTADIDAGLLKSKLLEVTRAATDIDGSGSRAKAVLRDVFEGFEAKEIGEDFAGDVIKETPEEVIDRISESVKFKDLYDLKARLASVIDSYRNDPTIQRRLIEFRNHITDTESGQMAFVIDNAPSTVSSQFQAADQLYKQAMADFSNSEPVRRLTDKFQEMRKFDTERGQIPGEFKRNEPDVNMGSNQFVDEVVGDTTGTLMSQLTTMLKDIRPETELNGAFRDLFRAQAANALRDAVASGVAKGSDNPQAVLFEAFRPVREQLQALGDTALLDDMTQAFNQIDSAYNNLGDLKLSNDQLLKQYEGDIKAAQEGIVGMLIDTPRGSAPVGVAGPTRSTPTSSAKQVLNSIMTSTNSENRMKELLDKIALLPDEAQRRMATEALQAVALDNVGSRIFGASPTAMKSGTEARRNMAAGAVKKLTEDDASNLFKSINTVFGKDSEMSDAVITLVNTMYQTSLPSRLRVSQAGSDTIINAARDSNIRDAVSTAILLTAGYMNPTAAMLRRITSVPIQEAEQLQKEVAAHVLARVVADPEKFEEMLRQISKGNEMGATDIAKAMGAEIGNASLLGIRYEFRVQEEDAFGEEDRGAVDRDMMQLFGGQ